MTEGEFEKRKHQRLRKMRKLSLPLNAAYNQASLDFLVDVEEAKKDFPYNSRNLAGDLKYLVYLKDWFEKWFGCAK